MSVTSSVETFFIQISCNEPVKWNTDTAGCFCGAREKNSPKLVLDQMSKLSPTLSEQSPRRIKLLMSPSKQKKKMFRYKKKTKTTANKHSVRREETHMERERKHSTCQRMYMYQM